MPDTVIDPMGCPVSVVVAGVAYSGRYWLHDGLLTVETPLGRQVALATTRSADVTARVVMHDIIEDALASGKVGRR